MSHKNADSGSGTATAGANYDPFTTSTTGSLPLLVRMPDGERHQVDVAPNASVKDLKSSIANLSSTWGVPETDHQDQPWDLDFGGSILNDNQTLGHYNIPDAYDHANSLLKTISGSGHADPDKKVEALDKACAVVQGISRGERDMERLINAVFDDVNDTGPDPPSAQPSLRALKRSRRSRIPPLNFGSLPPAVPVSLSSSNPDKNASPSAPPTPSQLMRKLSGVRPDLYAPSAAAKATASIAHPTPSPSRVPPSQQSTANEPPQPSPQHGSGELKRGNTWFTDVISSFGNAVLNPAKPKYEGDGSSEGEDDKENDVDGDSEGEGDHAGAPKPSHEASAAPNARQNATGDVKKEPISSAKEAPKEEGKSLAVTKDIAEASSRKEVRPKSDDNKGVASNAESPANKSSSAEKTAGTDNKLSPAEKAPGPSGPSANPQKQVIGLSPDTTTIEDVKLPKKRGRKRKNPHLTEEERKAQRQAQNRESAKLSRIRRKNMTIEYEKRVNTLEGENENLRDTVAALTDRLEMLQNLLTISVQKRPMPQLNAQGQEGIAGLPQLGTQPALSHQAPLTGQGALSAPGALGPHGQLTSQPQFTAAPHLGNHHQMTTQAQAHPGATGMTEPSAPHTNPLANLGYKNF